MYREKLFSFRVNQEERHTIKELANYFQRSQSDTIRFVLGVILRKLEQDPSWLNTIRFY
ncbi:MAG: hypothetical protein ISR58_13880 [Anaerolineales bacterium]|nr:hypothetical protein [Chloroflexota bacterium]MBL6982267.1 hypothetical protein [Anaerolineales bacterium]